MSGRFVLTVRVNLNSDPANANPFNNVYAYESDDTDADAFGCIEAFSTDVGVALAAVICGDAKITEMSCYNLDDLTDFSLVSFAVNGTAAGQVMPPFVAWEFQYVRPTREVGNGRKSIGPISEADVDSGVANSDALIRLNDLAELLEAPIHSTGDVAEFVPALWRRAGSYGDPPVPFVDTFYPITQVVYRKVSTQNTRKR